VLPLLLGGEGLAALDAYAGGRRSGLASLERDPDAGRDREQEWPVTAVRRQAFGTASVPLRPVNADIPVRQPRATSRPEQVRQTEQPYSITSSARASSVGGTAVPTEAIVGRRAKRLVWSIEQSSTSSRILRY
jgi:hypothetical protein